MLVVVPSIAAAVGARHVGAGFDLAALDPGAVWSGQVWRLVSHLLVAPSVWSLVFTGLAVYWFGSDLARRWGSPWFLRMLTVLGVASGVLVCLVAKVDHDVLAKSYVGTAPLTGALAVAWGLAFPDRVIRFWFVIAIPGRWFAWGTLLFTGLYAAYTGWEHELPELFMELGALAWVKQGDLLRQWHAARAKKAFAKPATRPRARNAPNLRLVGGKGSDDDDEATRRPHRGEP